MDLPPPLSAVGAPINGLEGRTNACVYRISRDKLAKAASKTSKTDSEGGIFRDIRIARACNVIDGYSKGVAAKPLKRSPGLNTSKAIGIIPSRARGLLAESCKTSAFSADNLWRLLFSRILGNKKYPGESDLSPVCDVLRRRRIRIGPRLVSHADATCIRERTRVRAAVFTARNGDGGSPSEARSALFLIALSRL